MLDSYLPPPIWLWEHSLSACQTCETGQQKPFWHQGHKCSLSQHHLLPVPGKSHTSSQCFQSILVSRPCPSFWQEPLQVWTLPTFQRCPLIIQFLAMSWYNFDHKHLYLSKEVQFGSKEPSVIVCFCYTRFLKNRMTPAGVSPVVKCGVPAQKVYLRGAVTEDVACQPAPLADQSLYQAEDHCPGVAGPKGHENPWDRIDEDCDQEAEFAAKPAEGKRKRRLSWRQGS